MRTAATPAWTLCDETRDQTIANGHTHQRVDLSPWVSYVEAQEVALASKPVSIGSRGTTFPFP